MRTKNRKWTHIMKYQIKYTTDNEHIATMPAVARRKGSEKINLSAPQQRQEAGTAAICQHVSGQHRTTSLKKERQKNIKNMTTKILTLAFVLFTTVSFAQTQTRPTSTVQQKQISENSIYQLFPTKNYWTFIKLDTRNGKMWQVHFTVTSDSERTELILNSISLVEDGEEIKGRFTLYPTENMYNFLLLDQIDGYVYQVQWSMTKENRGIVPIY